MISDGLQDESWCLAGADIDAVGTIVTAVIWNMCIFVTTIILKMCKNNKIIILHLRELSCTIPIVRKWSLRKQLNCMQE